MHADRSSGDEPPSFWRSRYAVGLVVFGAIAAYLLLSEHRAHLLGALPYLLLLGCPLMHVFMHRGHGSRDGHGARPPEREGFAPPPGAGERP